MARMNGRWLAGLLVFLASAAFADPLDPIYFGNWTPRDAPCGSEPRMVVTAGYVSFRNGMDLETFENLDACYGCEGRRSNLVRVTASPPSGQAAPFALLFTQGDRRGRVVAESRDSQLRNRFYLFGRPMRKCPG